MVQLAEWLRGPAVPFFVMGIAYRRFLMGWERSTGGCLSGQSKVAVEVTHALTHFATATEEGVLCVFALSHFVLTPQHSTGPTQSTESARESMLALAVT